MDLNLEAFLEMFAEGQQGWTISLLHSPPAYRVFCVLFCFVLFMLFLYILRDVLFHQTGPVIVTHPEDHQQVLRNIAQPLELIER